MPFPPGTKDASFDYESGLHENVHIPLEYTALHLHLVHLPFLLRIGADPVGFAAL